MADIRLKKSELDDWKDRIRGAMRNTDQLREDWRKYLQLYLDGDWTADENLIDLDRDEITVNLSFSRIKTEMPRLFFKVPHVFSPPQHPGDEDDSLIAGAFCNHLWQANDYKRQVRLCILDALIFGHGVMKHGFHSWSPMGYEDMIAAGEAGSLTAMAELQRDILAQQQGAPVLKAPAPVHLKGNDRRVHYDVGIKDGLPWAKRFSPFDFFRDPSGTDERTTRWWAFRYRMNLDAAKRNPAFRPSARSKLTPQGVVSGVADDTFLGHGRSALDHINRMLSRTDFGLVRSTSVKPFSESDPRHTLFTQVEFFEVYDLETNTFHTINMEVDEPLNFDLNPFTGTLGINYSELKFNDVPDSVWGMSDNRPLEPHQLEINQVRTQMLEYVKRMTNKKVAVDQNSIDDDNVRRLESSEMGGVVQLQTQDGNISRAIQAVEMGVLNPDVYSISQFLMNDWREVSGLGEQQLGLSGSAGTATGDSIVERNASLRIEDKQQTVVEFAEDVTRKQFQIASQFVGAGYAVRVFGPQGFGWVYTTTNAMNPDREIKIEVGSTIKQDNTIKSRRLIEALNVAVPLLVNGIVQVDVNELLRQFFESLEVFADVNRILQPDPAVLQQQLAFRQQIALAQAGGSADPNVGTNQAANLAGGAPPQQVFSGPGSPQGGAGDILAAAGGGRGFSGNASGA